jgi:integrase/recombinase XerD
MAKSWRNSKADFTTMAATTCIFYDKRHPKADGTCALSLRVTYNGQKRYYKTGISLTEEDLKKVQGEKPRREFKEIAFRLSAQEVKAIAVIKGLSEFTWNAFELKYLSNTASRNLVKQAFERYVYELRVNERIATSKSYDCAAKSLHAFSQKLKFSEITPAFLDQYEKWMLSSGRTTTTIGIYLRSLRTLFNNAIAEGILHKDSYPFGKRKYQIPTSENKKKALSMEDIRRIYYYYPEPGTTAELAKDLWIFMYLCNGINIKDVCLLKYKNIKGDFIEFQRAKTIRTKRNIELIRAHITEDLKTIISKHGLKDQDPDNYIFRVLTKGLTADRRFQLINQVTKVINDHLKVIATKLEIEGALTTYVARHSFATTLKRNGVSTSFIKDALGHSNESTTANYLASFEDHVKIDAAKSLTPWKDKTAQAS